MLDARVAEALGCSVGFFSTPTSVVQPDSAFDASFAPDMIMSAKSMQLGYIFAPHHFNDYPAGVKEHPGNLWTLDDCYPEDVTLSEGCAAVIVFHALFNPAASVYLPVKPLMVAATQAMEYVASWNHHVIQAVVPLNAKRPPQELMQHMHEAMTLDDDWRLNRPSETAVDLFVTLPCSAAEGAIIDVFDVLDRQSSTTVTWESVAEVEPADVPFLFHVGNVTPAAQALEIRVRVQEWGSHHMSLLVAACTAAAVELDWRCRAFTLVMKPAVGPCVGLPDPVMFFDRLENI